MPARHTVHPRPTLARLLASLALTLCLAASAGCSLVANLGPKAPDSGTQATHVTETPAGYFEGAGEASYFQALADLQANPPVYQGEPYVELNGGEPAFEASEATTVAFERYGALDELGRCTYTYACLGPETLATGPRENISHIKPSGWQRSEYAFIPGGILFTRAHLIARQLSDENANELNLVTGTRQLNAVGMLGLEEMTGDYIRETGNHVLYRVTPVFVGSELVARGVWMEAMSMEDGGAGVSFNVYVFNVQPGVGIDYATGDNWPLEGYEQTAGSQGGTAQDQPEQAPVFDCAYVLNVKSMRFHLPTCSGAATMSEKNRELSNETRDQLLDQGYEPCGTCQP